MLAEGFIEKGGYVCGAVLDSGDMEIRHKIADNTNDIIPMRKAKYAQSNIGMLYRDIKKLLDDEKNVMFTGTPCQVAGLYAFLEKDYDNLYTVDVVCNGVPSQKLLKTYVEEISLLPSVSTDDEPPKPVHVFFRNKKRPGIASNHSIRIQFDNGREYEGTLRDDDPFEHAYHDRLALRKSCSDCAFCEFPRQGDLSIGDFWDISEIEPGMSDRLGTSLVFVNNPKGRQLYDSIRHRLFKRKLMKIKTDDIKKNRLSALNPANPMRERFMNLLRSHSLADSGNQLVKIVVQFVDPTLVIALLCGQRVDLGGYADHASDVTGLGLSARHATQTSGHEQHTMNVATFLAAFHELLAGSVEHRDGCAVHDTLRTDVHIRTSGHLTILANAQSVVTLPVVGLAVVGNNHTVGHHHAGRILVRGEQAQGVSRIHHERLLVGHLAQILHHQAVLCPVLEDSAIAAVDDELARGDAEPREDPGCSESSA